jgi:G protein-coupled receptor GPR1
MQALESINAFEPHQAYILRVLSVVASCLSISAGLLAFYLYISMRVKVFRHHLILLLLMFDFGKALVLLWYPARVLLVPSAYDNINFCDVVGFFTSIFIEGADLAVLALAIHTALLIFRKSSGPEGGLYKFRYYVYGINILLPILMASLAFINNGRRSYAPLITWCYLPPRPLWYRLVLSWVPRYVILISIIAIYVSIYIYVKLEYSKVIKEFKQSQTYLEDNNTNTFDINFNTISSNPNEKINSASGRGASGLFTKWCMALKQAFFILAYSLLRFFSYFPGFSFLEPSKLFQGNSNEADLDPRSLAIREFQKDTMLRFQQRRNMIERQIRSIFVYPLAYVFLWIAPFAVHVLQFNYEIEHGPVYWIGAIAAFMQPFNCVIDTIAFLIRERPWVDREERIFTKHNADKLKYHLWRMLTCACLVHAKPRKDSSDSNTSGSTGQPGMRFDSTASTDSNKFTANIHTTENDENYSNSVFKAFDVDLEHFAKQQTSGVLSKPDFVDDSVNDSSPGHISHRSPSFLSQQQKFPGRGFNKQPMFDDHPFLSTTAKKVELDDDNASEGSMDLLEFLR